MAPNQSRTMKVKPAELGVRRAFEVHSHVLHNGMKILLVENPSLPTVSLNASVLTGARYDPESKAGVAIMASRLLDEGTETRTSFEIADAIESVGGAIEADGSFERVVVSAGVLNKDVPLGLELLADLLMRPIFPQEYVDKEKERTLAEIASAQDRPQVVAGWAFNELVYQDHPLHRPSHGYPETVERIERNDLLDFHEKYFLPNNVVLAVVGDFRVSELLPKIQDTFGSCRSRPFCRVYRDLAGEYETGDGRVGERNPPDPRRTGNGTRIARREGLLDGQFCLFLRVQSADSALSRARRRVRSGFRLRREISGIYSECNDRRHIACRKNVFG